MTSSYAEQCDSCWQYRSCIQYIYFIYGNNSTPKKIKILLYLRMYTFFFYFSTEILISGILLYLFCFYNFAKPVLISDLNKIIKSLLFAFCVIFLGNILSLCFIEPTSTQLFLFTAVSFIKVSKLTLL